MALTPEQLDEIDRIIKETVPVTDWGRDGDNSFEFVDGGATLIEAARLVREYLSTLSVKAEG